MADQPNARSIPFDERPPVWLEAESLCGTTLDGKYQLRGVLGVGGTAAVFAATHLGTEQPVAVKLLLARSFSSHQQLLRVLREARVAARLRHAHVIEVRDVSMDSGSPYIVMELLEGETLAAHVARMGCLSPAEALRLALPIMGALACAHDQGILHRDLKPANVFLARAGETVRPKLLDFGLAKADHGETITQSGTVLGTPSFMSPEQARDLELGPTSDVWAMGVLLFHCLSGKLPFSGSSLTDVLLKVVSTDPEPLHLANPSVPRAISLVVSRALARDPVKRPPNMGALARLLLDAAVQAQVSLPADPDPQGLPLWSTWLHEATRADLRTATGPMVPLRVEAPPGMDGASTVRPPRSRVLAIAALIVLVLGALLWLSRDTSQPVAPAQARPQPPVAQSVSSPASTPPVTQRPAQPPPSAIEPAPQVPELSPAAPPTSTRRRPSSERSQRRATRTARKPEAPAASDEIPKPLLELDTRWD